MCGISQSIDIYTQAHIHTYTHTHKHTVGFYFSLVISGAIKIENRSFVF